jgi:outer membrane immunogenic protein
VISRPDLMRYLQAFTRGHRFAVADGTKQCAPFFAALGATVLATSAIAADLPRKAPPALPIPSVVSWTGFYVGVHAGYSWGRWDGDLTFDPGTGPVVVFDPSNRTIDANGWLAGGQIGFNYQLNSVVFGLEADASWTNLKGDGSFNTIPGDFNWAIENQLDWFATVRGRAGVAVNNFLFYGTGGVAFGQTKGHQVVTNIIPCCLVTAVSSASENHIGWTAGGGVEWMYSRNWSVKAEYLYVDLGSADYRFVGTTFIGTPHTTDSFPADLTFHAVRLGVNYRF